MAQAGFTPISLYFSTTAAAVPTSANLVAGELALNTVDEKLYFKNSAGTVKLLASNATSAPVLSFSAGTTGFTPNTATTGAVTLAGTLATANGGTNLGGATPFTSGGVVYASSTSALATGSGLVFDGTNLGVGVTPSAWNTANYRVISVGDAAIINSRSGISTYNIDVGVNWYRDGAGAFLYKFTGFGTNYTQIDGAHRWYTAPSGTAGNAISLSEIMTLTAAGNLGIGTSSPAYKLDVTTATAGFATILTNTNGASDSNGLYVRAGTVSSEYNLRLSNTAGSTDFMVVKGDGNVGIGTTSPDHKLDISGSLCVDGFASPANNYITLRNSISPSSAGGLGFKAVDLGSGNDDGLGLYGHQGMIFYSAQTERMRITSAGNVGIGTSSPSQKLDVNGSVVISPNTAGKNTFSFVTNASNDARLLMKSDTTDKVDIQANGSSYFEGGTVRFISTISVGNSTPSSSGAGLTFPATQSASSDANTLDDYEEGTFTPTVVSVSGSDPTVGYGTRQAVYTKIGNRVSFTIYMTISSFSGGSGEIVIGGLPFTSQATNIQGISIGTSFIDIPAGTTSMTGYVRASNTLISLLAWGDNIGWVNGATSWFGTSGRELMISGTYAV